MISTFVFSKNVEVYLVNIFLDRGCCRAGLHHKRRIHAFITQSGVQLLVLETAAYELFLTHITVIVDVKKTEYLESPLRGELLINALIKIECSKDFHHFT